MKRKKKYLSDEVILKLINDYSYLFGEPSGMIICPVYLDFKILDLCRNFTPLADIIIEPVKEKSFSEKLLEKICFWKRGKCEE